MIHLTATLLVAYQIIKSGFDACINTAVREGSIDWKKIVNCEFHKHKLFMDQL